MKRRHDVARRPMISDDVPAIELTLKLLSGDTTVTGEELKEALELFGGWEGGNTKMQVDVTTVQTLHRLAPVLDDWLAQDPSNVERFIADPLREIRNLVPDLAGNLGHVSRETKEISQAQPLPVRTMYVGNDLEHFGRPLSESLARFARAGYVFTITNSRTG